MTDKHGVQLTEVDYDPFATPELDRAVVTTAAQREVWLADRLGTEASLAYNESVTLHMAGTLDEASLAAAVQGVVDRHEALRATFSDDGLDMLIAPQLSVWLESLDLSALSDADQAREVARVRAAAVETPFDLARGPLLRAQLLRLGAQRHELVLTAHHIVCDGWSFGVIARDLMALYGARIGSPAAQPLLPADRFSDHVAALQDPEHLAAAQADLAWWVQQFDADVPVLELPTDRPRRAVRTFASRREDVVIDAEVTEAVRKLAARQGVSLFVMLFGTFGALLSRLSGQSEVVVGVPMAGQAALGHHQLVGHAVNLLPVRLQADLDTPADALLTQWRSQVLDAFDHQACTFGELLEKLQLPRDASRLPLVSVIFNLDQAMPSEAISLPGLQVSLSGNPRHFENFDLFVNASQTDGGIVLECQYNTDLLDAASVRRWLDLYRQALARLVADVRQPLTQAMAPGAADLEALAAFNATAQDHNRAERIDDLIARQTAATPDAPAVVAAGQTLSYRELDQRANALAAELRHRGVGPGDLVGLCCGRNAHMMVALVGILKSGAGYVPMDPAFPADRLAFMREDAHLRCVVSDPSVSAEVVSAQERLDVAALGLQAEAPERRGTPEDIAYVIYTSGTTGRPKGVQVPHRTVVNLLHSVAREPGMRAGQRVLAVTTLSFDIAVSEVLAPLAVGAAVIVADRAQATDGDRLRELIEREAVDFIDATPSTWRLLLAAGWAGKPGLTAICTGEPLPQDLARELLPRVGALWNGYGPTETTVWSSFHRLSAGDGIIPIGRPVANTQIHVVDSQLRPVPVGVSGELYIGGEGVTLGYLGRPDLTAERFLPDPFRPGHTWYKTGDLGRWRADGVLECLGRSDDQVKVRGYRIELGEIESSLCRHPDVDRAIVITREDEPGDVRLVAYAVSRGATLEEDGLRAFLRQWLPEYMIPSHVVALPALPLLPNGKINRKGLPKPVAQARNGRDSAPPTTELQAQVLGLIEAVLKLPGLGVRDDFFALGGHSLLAAQLIARLNKALDVALPLRAVFESPTAEALARAVETARHANAPRIQPVQKQADQTQAPLTLMQERIRFMDHMYPGRVVYNTPSAHRLRGPFDAGAFDHALRQLVQLQPSLRTSIVVENGQPLQRVHEHVDFTVPLTDLSLLDDAAREPELMRLLQAEVDRPMDIARAPLFRAALYRLSAQEHVFLFMPHHIVWDGWSFDLLYEELAALYPAALDQRPATLPLPPVSYVDFAHWHHDWMASEACRQQVAYWKAKFAGVQVPRSLPTDRARQSGMTGEGAVEWVRIDTELTEALRQRAQDQGLTLNMLVMGVYAALMSQAIGSDTIVLGVPVRGRLSTEVESVMGFFNNLLPVPLKLDTAQPLAVWLQQVKRDMLDAFAHQDVPFERLVTEPEVAASANKVGLYQSLFSFQDARARQRNWGPLQHSSVLVMQKGATEDFGLWLMEVPGGLEGGINYNADVFDALTAQVFRERLLGLLRRVAQAPHLSVSALLAQPGADALAFAAWLQSHAPERAAAQAARTVPAQVPGATATVAAAPAHKVGQLGVAQARMAEVWAGLLGVETRDIGLADNFFDLGGNSLLVMQAVAEAERVLGLQLDPRRFVYEPLGQLVPAAAAPVAAQVGASSAATQGLARIWAELLGVSAQQIEPGDNFFDLGGNSLLVMRAVSEAHQQLGLDTDPRRYVYETLQQLCDGASPAAAPGVVSSTGAAALVAAEAEGVEGGAAASNASGGLLSRVFGRLGRRS